MTTTTAAPGTTTITLTRGEQALLLRALRIYMATYQRMVGAEPHPANKAALREYVTAAEQLFNRLFLGGTKQRKHKKD